MIQRPWALWRRVYYATGFFVLLGLFATTLYYQYWYEEPNCFDGVQNADERDIDCGGSCERICAFDIVLPVSLWAESFEIVAGQYNAVAYVENRNRDVGSPALTYTFILEDDAGVIVERSGTTVLPPDGVYPVFEGRIQTGNRIPTKTSIRFDNDITWKQGKVGRDQFTLGRRELVNVDSKPELTAELTNNDLAEAQDVEVIATLFDAQKRPLTASRTFLEYFKGRTTETVVFTWPEPIAKTLRSCEVPTDVILGIDLSGSMNNDGGNPPQPITSVLTSAAAFVDRLGASDQVGVVTYATQATVTVPLTEDSVRVRDAVTALTINPKEETGSTNTGEALMRIGEELSSVRHSSDARKVAILLTDGLATGGGDDPEVYAEEIAQKIKNRDIELFTIGLGVNLNEDALKKLASTPEQYYSAPTTRELDAIYTAITQSICEDGPTVIEIIPKPKTSFR